MGKLRYLTNNMACKVLYSLDLIQIRLQMFEQLYSLLILFITPLMIAVG